ncbi:hypothetical protein [Plesiocystis pacifica]|uniref:hypothetical protein n=1 Tax=Plesiocystis pacifica TaxID=191768 RepID=UPI0012F786DE|nr:hypothetical protein [Plesiocystis pacifica]
MSDDSYARYWPCNSTVEDHIEFSPDIISRYLIYDWLPDLGAINASDFMGWPARLTESVQGPLGERTYLGLQSRVGLSERQWSGFLSWMIGVAGARHVLAREGYGWVAPASAFYPEARAEVATGALPPGLIPTELMVARPSPPTSNLRPDYLAVRKNDKGLYELALAEAKGTGDALQNKEVCPPRWREQVRNATVSWQGRGVVVSRHIVIATRSNSKAKYAETRRFQIRAWNSEEPESVDQPGVIRAIAVVQLYGLARNLALPKLAKGILMGEWLRLQEFHREDGLAIGGRNEMKTEHVQDQLLEQQKLFYAELERLDEHSARIGSGVSTYSIELMPELLQLMRRLATPKTIVESQSFVDYMDKSQLLRTADSTYPEQSDEPSWVFPGVRVHVKHRGSD